MSCSCRIKIRTRNNRALDCGLLCNFLAFRMQISAAIASLISLLPPAEPNVNTCEIRCPALNGGLLCFALLNMHIVRECVNQNKALHAYISNGGRPPFFYIFLLLPAGAAQLRSEQLTSQTKLQPAAGKELSLLFHRMSKLNYAQSSEQCNFSSTLLQVGIS